MFTRRRVLSAPFALIVLALMAFSCGRTADEDRPLDQVRQEAQGMDASALRQQAETYRDAIVQKGDELKQLTDRIGQIDPSRPLEQLANDTKELQEKAKELQDSVAKLTERYQVYIDELIKKGADAAGLELP